MWTAAIVRTWKTTLKKQKRKGLEASLMRGKSASKHAVKIMKIARLWTMAKDKTAAGKKVLPASQKNSYWTGKPRPGNKGGGGSGTRHMRTPHLQMDRQPAILLLEKNFSGQASMKASKQAVSLAGSRSVCRRVTNANAGIGNYRLPHVCMPRYILCLYVCMSICSKGISCASPAQGRAGCDSRAPRGLPATGLLGHQTVARCFVRIPVYVRRNGIHMQGGRAGYYLGGPLYDGMM
ncbi:uncharacterized protein GGS22DRAFT_38023 [Annulohypoxylon maeteangense]|uniref:uncharacterized protein n=1 Tax=Annulohypoxylon maeteangense TaxID=1927788 RepID=UPI002007A1B9|nr:uncharacterized protein GGS22DRAFT_38023 [Annulohypoxylon maeteangense]KAI0883260.1 hypothetical protein GGS22DRAFT_38023 [Annulohypoxylon maeteangense]